MADFETQKAEILARLRPKPRKAFIPTSERPQATKSKPNAKAG